MHWACIHLGPLYSYLTIRNNQGQKEKIIFRRKDITGLIGHNYYLHKRLKPPENRLEAVLAEYSDEVSRYQDLRRLEITAPACMESFKAFTEACLIVKERFGKKPCLVTDVEIAQALINMECKTKESFLLIYMGEIKANLLFGHGQYLTYLINLELPLFNLWNRFLKHDPLQKEKLVEMRKFIVRQLDHIKVVQQPRTIRLIGDTMGLISKVEPSTSRQTGRIHIEYIRELLPELKNIYRSRWGHFKAGDPLFLPLLIPGLILAEHLLDFLELDQVSVVPTPPLFFG